MIKRSFALTATTSLQTIYTVPEGARTEWKMMWVSNISGSNATIDVTYYNAVSSSTISLFDDYTISSKEFLKLAETLTSF